MTGILRRARVVALPIMAILCLVVATAATSARNTTSTCTAVKAVTVCTTLNTATFKFSTSVKTKASVSTSIDTSYALTVLDQRPKKVHTITIPEAPAKLYHFKVTATPTTGKASTWTGVFKTGAIGSVPANLTNRGSRLLVNGVPTTLVIAAGNGCQTANYVSDIQSLGAQTLDESVKEPCDLNPLTSATANEVWLLGKTNDQKQYFADLPNYLGNSAVTYVANDAGWGCKRKSDADLYKLVRSHADKTVVSSLTLSENFDFAHQNCLTPEGLHSLFWVNFVAGGKAIEYYTINWTNRSDQDNFSVVPDIPAQATKDADELATLNPVISTGMSLAIAVDPASPIKVGAWSYGGVTYVVAANTDATPASTSVSLSRIKASAATGMWGTRSAAIKAGKLTANLSGFAVSFWKLVPPSTKK